jgi:outer membrane immunogenic protein
MRKLFVAAAGLALLSGAALAADLPSAPAYRPPPPLPPPPPTVSWTGCSLNGGYGYGLWNEDQFLETDPAHVATSSSVTSGGRGWLGRGGAGCDYQFGVGGLGNFVVGAFGDYDFMNIHGNMQPAAPISGLGTITGDQKETGAWYAGARIGALITPNLLTYFDGGYTQTHFDSINFNGATSPFGSNIAFTQSHNYHGWFLGSGTEYALNFSWLPIQGLFWRNEYRYATYNAENLSVFLPTGALTGSAVNIRPYTQTITSSLVWRFNWMGH